LAGGSVIVEWRVHQLARGLLGQKLRAPGRPVTQSQPSLRAATLLTGCCDAASQSFCVRLALGQRGDLQSSAALVLREQRPRTVGGPHDGPGLLVDVTCGDWWSAHAQDSTSTAPCHSRVPDG
jgi:hypothetical protein